jgi:hypothetical protein
MSYGFSSSAWAAGALVAYPRCVNMSGCLAIRAYIGHTTNSTSSSGAVRECRNLCAHSCQCHRPCQRMSHCASFEFPPCPWIVRAYCLAIACNASPMIPSRHAVGTAEQLRAVVPHNQVSSRSPCGTVTHTWYTSSQREGGVLWAVAVHSLGCV